MAKYRKNLPQLGGDIFLTDGGVETSLIYHHRFDLPHFAAFHLMRERAGRDGLRAYFRPFAALAAENRLGFILETPTWRANPDWAAKLGYTAEALATANREAVALMQEMRFAFETSRSPMVISGNIGPRGDGYRPEALMSAKEAEAYHAPQVATFRDAGADLVSAVTINYVEEAIGVAAAADALGMPSVISFTVETDGKLPTGHTLEEAIGAVDAATGGAPAYYMVNCAHPTHFAAEFDKGGAWIERVGGVRANASAKSHAELDAATELDPGDPAELGRQYAELRRKHPGFTVLGGCCGTDHRHVREICLSCMATA